MNKSDLLHFLEDEEGFEINDPYNTPSKIGSSTIYSLFDLLIRYGVVKNFGYENIFLITPHFGMIYYPGEPKEQFIPVLNVEFHNPKFIGLRTHFRFSLRNGIFVEWDSNGIEHGMIQDFIRQAKDSELCGWPQLGSGDDGVIILRYCNNKDEQYQTIVGQYMKLYTSLYPEILKAVIPIYVARKKKIPDLII